MDLAARNAQVARLVAHASGADSDGEATTLSYGAQKNLPATFLRESYKASDPHRGAGQASLVLISIARAVLGEYPRAQQSFTGPDGASYRIVEDRSVPHAPLLVFACAATRPIVT